MEAEENNVHTTRVQFQRLGPFSDQGSNLVAECRETFHTSSTFISIQMSNPEWHHLSLFMNTINVNLLFGSLIFSNL